MSKRTWSACACLALALHGFAGPALAADVTPHEYMRRLKVYQTIEPQGGSPFGESLNPYTGELTFKQADVVYEGIGPTIQLVRFTRSVQDIFSANPTPAGAFAGWSLSVPTIHTISDITGWVVGPASDPDRHDRCTQYNRAMFFGDLEDPNKGHEGISLTTESGDLQTILKRASQNTLKPTMLDSNGAPIAFPAVTKGNWQIGCLAQTSNGEPGEAFLALSPEGEKYYFDRLIYTPAPMIEEPEPMGGPPHRQLRSLATMYVTRIEDRFGNWLKYNYAGDNLTEITASDGRIVRLAWSGEKVVSITAQPGETPERKWEYQYSASALSSVSLPDNSTWTFPTGLGGVFFIPPTDATYCNIRTRSNEGSNITVEMIAPSGLKGSFIKSPTWHARNYVMSTCVIDHTTGGADPYELEPPLFRTSSLTRKTFSGPGMASQTWTYAYQPAVGTTTEDACAEGGTCPSTNWVDVTDPAGNRERHTYSNRYGKTEGQLKQTDSYKGSSTLLRTEALFYAASDRGPYPSAIGGGNDTGSNAGSSSENVWQPLQRRVVTQQGVTFQYTVNHFDVFARPLEVLRDSSLYNGRAEVTTYHDNLNIWVLGQVAQVKCTAPTTPLPTGCGTSGTVMSSTTYDSTYGLPLTHSSYGKLQQTLTYDTTSSVASGQRGTLKTVKDGNNNVTTLSNWYRGIPRSIQFPATPDQPSGTNISAVVNGHGWITSTTDENNYVTSYVLDAMGRLTRMTYPTGDSTTWSATTVSFAAAAASEYGIAGTHWKQTISTGAARKITYFDALWRPVLVHGYDTTDQTATQRFAATSYSLAGGQAFGSYPLVDAPKMINGQWTGYMEQGLLPPPPPDCDPGEDCDEPPGPPPPGPPPPPPPPPPTQSTLPGIHTTYDALGRVVTARQDSELGDLLTTTEYLTGFKIRVTNPRGFQTTTNYLVYDTPSTDWPVAITHPEGAYTSIVRDVFGKPLSMARNSAGNGVWNGRYYAYDQFQRLCKLSELETGTNAMGYDDAGNLLWSAAGQSWSPTGACLTPEAVATRRVDREYDARNRLLALEFPDGQGDQYWSYTPDGLPAQVSTFDAGQETINAYTYNKRRMLTGEAVTQLYGWGTWSLGYGYNGNGHLANQVYPGGLTIPYAPNALGQATQAGSFATGVSRYANGAIHAFNYGNGIAYNMIQNARQLPEWTTASSGAMHYSYAYDENGNVNFINDHLGTGANDRTMTYDGLDRLKTATAPTPMWGGTLTYGYDQLDNLITLTGAGRNLRYCYNDNKQLTFVRNNATSCSNGAAVHAMDYDVQGNVSSKDEVGYQFDVGNRLREVEGKETYRYDALGRRVRATSLAGDIISVYSQGGQLMFQQDYRRNINSNYVYLDGSLVAIQEIPIGGGAVTFKYQHTDALGSPVAVTSSAKAVLERSHYEPYGKLLNRPLKDGPGFTGHVSDAQTGLSYMQQRYYDPGIGRFLSVDPVTADAAGGTNFNRYWYADNNPYRFTDPDGRATCADKACKTSTIDSTVPRANSQPPPVNGTQGLPTSIAQKVDEGYSTSVTFQNDDPNGASPNQPVTTATAKMVEGAISKLGAQTVNINSTTGGHAGKISNHNAKKAVDINSVNGMKMKTPSGLIYALPLQKAGASQPNIRENFGPAFTQKTMSPGAQPVQIHNAALTAGHSGDKAHVHLSGQD